MQSVHRLILSSRVSLRKKVPTPAAGWMVLLVLVFYGSSPPNFCTSLSKQIPCSILIHVCPIMQTSAAHTI